MPMTSFEKGEHQGERKLLRKQLEARFGPLSAAVQQRIDALSTERIEELGVELLTAQSLEELGLTD